MYPEYSVDWLTLGHALQILGLCVDAYVVTLLLRAYRVIQERNRQLAENTKTLERHNRLIETVGKILISLYPDHDHPEEAASRGRRKAQVIEMWRRASQDE